MNLKIKSLPVVGPVCNALPRRALNQGTDQFLRKGISMKKALLLSLFLTVALFQAGCKPSDTEGDGCADNNGNGKQRASNCPYTTANLNGCFQPQNSGMLEYYCFDGFGGYYYENWNPIAGCSGRLENGSYAVDGCKTTICDSTGCAEYTIEPSGDGLLVDGEYYSASNGCN